MTNHDFFRALILIGLMLGPLIPTWVVYRVIKDNQTRANVHGRLFGMRVETAGAIGSYLACVLIALLLYKVVFASTTALVQVVINATGDPNRIDRFLTDARDKSRLVLTRDDGMEIRLEHFDVDAPKRVLRGALTVPAGDIRAQYKPAFSYASQMLRVTTPTVTLSETLSLTVDFGGSSAGQWAAVADIKSYTFRNDANDLYIRQLIFLEHDSIAPLDSIPLHSFLDLGQLVYLEVGARAVERDHCSALARQWARESTSGQSPDVLQSSFELRYPQFKTEGEEIAARRFTNSDFNLPGQGERFQRGPVGFDDQRVMPTIGPVAGGLDNNKGIVVYAESWRKIDAETRRKNREIAAGETFERPTDGVLFMIGSEAGSPIDMNSTRIAFKTNLLYPVGKLGDPLFRRGNSALALDLRKLNAGDVTQVYWSWK